MRRLEATRDAIVGYALRHRTRERVVKFEDDWSEAEWSFRLPKGRPYLPCPDWDGDGFEDPGSGRRGRIYAGTGGEPRLDGDRHYCLIPVREFFHMGT